MDLTTIKLSKSLRDRISAAAADEGYATHQKFLERLMDEHDRHKLGGRRSSHPRHRRSSARLVAPERQKWATADSDTEAMQ